MSWMLCGKRSITQPNISHRMPDRVVTDNLLAAAIVIGDELPFIPMGATVLGESRDAQN